MAAVLEKNDPAARHESQVDEQIAQASSRIRAHDLAFGGLVLVALVLVYAVAMILLDKYLVLPEWVRQGALGAFGALVGGTAYLALVRPLRKQINPLYAAKRVEGTIDDPKNSVTGYVDAREKGDLNGTVKAALASRAAAAAAAADVDRAVDHRSLRYLGGVAVACFLALVVLFFVFRGAQFMSLLGRTFVPFSSDPIATRTQLALVKPEPADPTITTGQSVTVQVRVEGRVPAADAPDKVRLLVRHNPADPNYEELPMVPGATNRDWELRVPDYLVQNGFWYKVRAGDAETPEYKVTVRALPAFTEFRATYEYPKYLRRAPDTVTEPAVRAPRGTTVTLTAKTNREVRSGDIVIDRAAPVAGAPVPNDPKALQFTFKVANSGSYKLVFVATNGERSADVFQAPITVESDHAPQVVITKPEEEETTAPANGQLAVDGKIGDDHGIATVALKMKLVAPVERPLPDVPYLNGTAPTFRRDKDGTFPTNLDYKGSVDLAKLTKDAAGVALKLDDKCVIEFWLEATDNCTEPKANVGKSAAKRLRLTPPVSEPMEQKTQDDRKNERKNEEQKHGNDQKQKLDNENRDPNKKDGQGGKTEPKTGKDGNDGKGGDPKGDVGKTADDLQRQLDREKNSGGDAKPNPSAATNPDERPNPAEQKPKPQDMPGMNGMNGAAEPKPEPKPTDPMQPPGMNPGAPAETKTQGDTKKPDEPGQQKPQPQPQGGTDPKTDKKDNAPAEERGAPGPGAGVPGNDKDPPPPAPKGGDPKRDPSNGGAGKPGTDPKDVPQPGAPKAGPPEAAPKPPVQEPKRGDEKPAPQQNPAEQPKPGAPEAGDGKPKTAPAPADTKPMPKDPMMMPGGADSDPKPAGGANDMKDPNGGTNAAETKPDDKKDAPTGTGGKPPEKGAEKPVPKDNKNEPNGGGTDAPMPKEKIDDKTRRDLEEAANNLNSPDENKRRDAQKKLDDAIGKDKREELEKLQKDLNSSDKATRDAARQKVEDLKKELDKKNPAGGGDTKGPKDPPKIDDKTKQEIENAVNDLNSPDPDKKRAAQEKLDKLVGEKNRKEAEQLMQDLRSDDKDKREAAQQKLDELRKQLEGKKDDAPTKGKEPTKEEIDDLVKKAQDLNSPDEAKRKQAEKDLDDKIGEEARKKLQDEMKKKDMMPPDPERLKREMEEWNKGPGRGTPNKGPMESDAKNRAKTAQLQLEEFKKDENRDRIKKQKDWTDAEYDKFIKDMERYVDELKKVAERPAPAPAPSPKDAKDPVFNPGTAGKVDGPRGMGDAGVGGPTVAPPGFEDLRKRFNDALKKK
ncbi:MAG: hypothetical protein FJ304_00045 [Planctomycetes bacterium]|nr:hypothetical protein [Planctomycetota bacterium]